MKVSEKVLAIIKKYEGCRLTAYVCPAGKLTIGYGHTKGVKKGQKIGEIQYSKGNIMIHKEKILAQETINKADFLTQIKKISTQYFLILSHFL